MKKSWKIAAAALLLSCLIVLLICARLGKRGAASPHDDFFNTGRHITTFTYGEPVTHAFSEKFLDISYVLHPYSVERLVSERCPIAFWLRGNTMGYGLNQFCPSTSYLFPDGGELPSFLDVYVREKDGPVGENFSHLSLFWLSDPFNYFSMEDSGRRLCESTVTTESYRDAADFYEKNFAAAEAGTDPAYCGFTRLDDEEIGGAPACHYSFYRAVEPGAPLKGEYEVRIPYEIYGEHYLFETDQYIYLFAFSGQEPNERYLKTFRTIIDSIQIDPEGFLEPPIWKTENWLEEQDQVYRCVKNLKDMPEYHQFAGTTPDCLQEMIDQLPSDS